MLGDRGLLVIDVSRKGPVGGGRGSFDQSKDGLFDGGGDGDDDDRRR
jgi:hypothetical protein